MSSDTASQTDRPWARRTALGLAALLVMTALAPAPANSVEAATSFDAKIAVNSWAPADITLYSAGQEILIDIKKVAEITRSKVSTQYGKYTLRHGEYMRVLTFDPSQRSVSESIDGGETSEVYDLTMVAQDGTLLVPLYKTLTYLGANVDRGPDDVITVDMPLKTFWEVFNFVFEGDLPVSQIDHSDFRLFLDNVVDFVNPGGKSVYDLFSGSWQKDSIYAALDASPLRYDAAKDSAAGRTDWINQRIDEFRDAKTATESALDVAVLLDDARFARIMGLADVADRGAAFVSYMDDAKLTSKIRGLADKASKSSTVIDAAILGVDIANTIFERANANEAAKEALTTVFSRTTLNNAGNPSLNQDFVTNTREVASTMSSTTSLVLDTAVEKSASFLSDQVVEKLVLGGIGSIAYQLSGVVASAVLISPIGKYTLFAEIPKAEASRIGILAADAYNQTWEVYAGLVDKVISQQAHNQQTINQFYYSYLLMLRFSLVWDEAWSNYMDYTAKSTDRKAWFDRRAEAVADALYETELYPAKAIPRMSDLDAGASIFHGGSAAHTYAAYSVDSVQTWDQAQAYCAQSGGHLATISSSAENEVVYQVAKGAGYDSAYFGLSDAVLEGLWKWVTGEPTVYTNWAEGEPNSENEAEDYAEFYWKSPPGQWNDGDFGNRTNSDTRAFICEWDNGQVPPAPPAASLPSAPPPSETNRTCPFEEPLSPVELAKAGASCAWGYTEYCDCV
ncbi:MAG: hypothetical protein LBJ62_01800 [Bifidobacteriaceae bacterium]|jgi:hypothetical protein|nr:hypothetical protein [Bifidobacteriaceae bacterium]